MTDARQIRGDGGRTDTRTAVGLRLNFLPVRIATDRGPCTQIDATQVPYRSEEDLKQLRAATAGTHIVFRHGSMIHLVELHDDVPSIGEPVTLDLTGRGTTVPVRLLQEAVRRLVTEHWPYRLRKAPPSPPVFVSRQHGRDLLDAAHAGHPATAPYHVYPENRLAGRYLAATQDIGVIIGLKTRYEMDLTAQDLLRLGMDLTGRYALTADGVEPFPHQDLHYARRLLGRIVAVDQDQITVHTVNGRTEQHHAATLWLETRKDVFDDALSLAAGRDARTVLAKFDTSLHELVGGPGRLKTTRRIAAALAKEEQLALAKGVHATFLPVLGDGPRCAKVAFRTLTEPVFGFDMTGHRSAPYPEPGLRKHGPLDRERFTPKRPNVVVVTPAHHQRTVEEFITGFRDGVPRSSFAEGFVRLFCLSGLDVSLVTFESSEADAGAYRRACLRALDKHPDADLAIVVISKKQQHLTGNASPYLVSKSVFMSRAVPVQEFQVENIRGRTFPEVLRNVSLACYAKLGGTPYLIREPHRPRQGTSRGSPAGTSPGAPGRETLHELVIGLGSAYRTTDRLVAAERSVGITTVFSTMGNYMIASTSREADYDDYPEALHEALTACITDVRDRSVWQPQDVVRLVFHVFKPFKDREAIAVKRLVEDLAGHVRSVEFAFVHVSDAHDWMLFDPSTEGLERKGGARQGAGIPCRGLAVRLGPKELLVTVHGPRDLKTATQGAPRPLLLKLHRESTFNDLDYLADQLFRFTAMSWRRPFPAAKPVTILYSEMMASLLGQLREVRNWNADMINRRLQTSRWFL